MNIYNVKILARYGNDVYPLITCILTHREEISFMIFVYNVNVVSDAVSTEE
jgi:hypothetical protein